MPLFSYNTVYTVVAGNHEFVPDVCSMMLTNCTHFIKDSVITLPEFNNLTIYGSRYKPFFSGFTGRYEDMKQSFDDYPLNKRIDIAVTHAPPKFKTEKECHHGNNLYYNCVNLKTVNSFFRRGSKPLAERMRQNPPQVSIFGHNHEIYGFTSTIASLVNKNRADHSMYPITFISGVSLDDYSHENQLVVRPPIVFDLVI